MCEPPATIECTSVSTLRPGWAPPNPTSQAHHRVDQILQTQAVDQRPPPPAEALDLCERWLEQNHEVAGDIRTAASADAYYVSDIVLAVHAHATVGSSERNRSLELIDRLIEAGAADANNKLDSMEQV